MRKCRIAIIAVVLASIPLAPMPVAAQTAAPATDWTRRAVTIPMRDGIKLHTVIVSPANQQRPLPTILLRTPYGVSGYLACFAPSVLRIRTTGWDHGPLAAGMT